MRRPLTWSGKSMEATLTPKELLAIAGMLTPKELLAIAGMLTPKELLAIAGMLTAKELLTIAGMLTAKELLTIAGMLTAKELLAITGMKLSDEQRRRLVREAPCDAARKWCCCWRLGGWIWFCRERRHGKSEARKRHRGALSTWPWAVLVVRSPANVALPNRTLSTGRRCPSISQSIASRTWALLPIGSHMFGRYRMYAVTNNRFSLTIRREQWSGWGYKCAVQAQAFHKASHQGPEHCYLSEATCLGDIACTPLQTTVSLWPSAGSSDLGEAISAFLWHSLREQISEGH